jgi:septal ring factor EnvC (AmiA/AmiB activator)
MTYLKSYRQNREAQANAIVKSDQLLNEKITTLSTNKKERLTALVSQSQQLKELQDDKKEQDQVVADLKGKEKELARQISDKEKQRQKMQAAVNAIIRRLVEEERKKALAAAKQKALDDKKNQATNDAAPKTNTAPATTARPKSENSEPVTGVVVTSRDRAYSPLESTPEGVEMSINFENNKGRLPWPVGTGIVTAQFGVTQIPKTKLTRKTDGIEISLPIGSTVRSVADGEVVYADEVDGEKVMILKHGKYLTSYSNMSSLSVSKGQAVKAGSVLGKSGTSIDGEGVMIFSIMNDKGIQQNPELWLKGKR